MLSSGLFRALVPDAPANRRTERDDDLGVDERIASRIEIGNTLTANFRQPGLQRPGLVSSCDGAIRQVLLCLPAFAVTEPRFVEGYKSLIQKLRAGTQFVVVHHRQHESTVRSWFVDAGHQVANVALVPLESYVRFTDWAEDAYVALHDEVDDSSYLMEPWEFPRAGDALIAEAVQEYANVTASQAPLIFQGGNCLIGSDFWLLGKDYFVDSIDLVRSRRGPVVVPDGTDEADFVSRLFSDYVDRTRRLILVGTNKAIPLRPMYGSVVEGSYFLDIVGEGVGSFQPIFHIDMFITLVGKDAQGRFTVLVGSPKLGDDLLGRSSPYSLAGVYDQVERQLAAQGMNVIRNPLVHDVSVGPEYDIGQLREMARARDGAAISFAVNQLIDAGASLTDKAVVRSWHHVTWNNCLVENSEEVGKHVYLPTYGGANSNLAVIDQKMKGMWNGLGFSVHMLADFNEFARRQGAVHCISKYLERGG